MNKKLAVFFFFSIQYQVPIWRHLAAMEGLDIIVYYFSDHSVRGRTDSDFGTDISWDVPLLEGYSHHFLQRHARLTGRRSARISNPGRLLSEGGFDGVLIQSYVHMFERQIAMAAQRLQIKTILRAELTDRPYRRGPVKTLLRNVYLKWFYRYIDVFCCIGDDARRHLRKRNISEDRIFFSPYAVDTALFEAQKNRYDRNEARNLLGIDEKEFVLLFSGKLIPRKAPLLLAKAIETIIDRENVTLIVLGEGQLRQPFEEKMRKLLGKRLHMAGFINQSQLGQYYRAADLFVHPAEFETWGLVVNEAMQFGLPVIVSDHAGCRRDLVIEGQTGSIFPANNTAALATKIESLLHNREQARGMGRQAEKHIAGYTTEAAARGIVQSLA